MAGKTDNLLPVRSASEARAKGKKGGIASGKARREKKTLRQTLEVLLAMPSEGDKSKSNIESVAVALLKKAQGGDVYAFATLRDTIGEKPTDKVEHSGDPDNPICHEHGVSPAIEAIFTRMAKSDQG